MIQNSDRVPPVRSRTMRGCNTYCFDLTVYVLLCSMVAERRILLHVAEEEVFQGHIREASLHAPC